MYKDSSDRLLGNDAFEGFAIELISEIAQILSKFYLISEIAQILTL